VKKKDTHNFSSKLLQWYDLHGRKDLPWQQSINAYRVWVSEIMLQQTQVNTVTPYYLRFMHRFANVDALAAASTDEVMHHWSGLGYYSRARNLHATALRIRDEFSSQFPNDIDLLQSLPGIGRSTAGAICAIAFNSPCAILDGNVKRVLARHNNIDGWPGKSSVAKQLWQIAEQHTPTQRNRDYTQAIMDLGATVCTRSKPRCNDCPVMKTCIACAEQTMHELPGKKPKKVLPEKSAKLLLIENSDGEILLFKKPPTGVWGGLWSLPDELEIDAAMQLDMHSTWPMLRHTFSHYHFDITPVHCKLSRFTGTMDGANQLWYNISMPPNIGIAAPIKKLLQQYANEKSTAP